MILIRFAISGCSNENYYVLFFSQAAVESLCALCDTLNSDPDMAALDMSDNALYTGITRQNDVWDECLRWLTRRGIMNSDGTFSGSTPQTGSQNIL